MARPHCGDLQGADLAKGVVAVMEGMPGVAEVQSTTCENQAGHCRMEGAHPNSRLLNDLWWEDREEMRIGAQRIATEIARKCTALALDEAQLVHCSGVMAVRAVMEEECPFHPPPWAAW